MPSRAILLVLILVATLVTTPAASAASKPKPKPTKTKAQPSRVSAPSGCPYARLGVAFYRGHFVRHQLRRGAEVEPTWRKPRNCADARYLADVWASRARVARVRTQRHLERMARRTLDEQRTWIRAMREVQVAYPGTEAWLRSCSSSEGAGRNLSINYFQMNHQGSGAGGYMQFMESTFWRMYNAAVADLKARGFVIDPRSANWSSRVGQAMAAAWGLTHGRRGEWSGSGC